MKRMRTTQALLLTLATLTLVTCSSDSDDADRRPRSYPRGADGGRSGIAARAGAGDGLDMMPPADWWRDPQISVAVTLTPDQLASLDKIGHEQSEEIAKLERDSMVAARELRETFDGSQPATADIVAAGQRMRGIRDALFDRRVQMFAPDGKFLKQLVHTATTFARDLALSPDPD